MQSNQLLHNNDYIQVHYILNETGFPETGNNPELQLTQDMYSGHYIVLSL